ncbi:MAG: polysaccharide deacetylase family protein [Bacteroidota bacterium]
MKHLLLCFLLLPGFLLAQKKVCITIDDLPFIGYPAGRLADVTVATDSLLAALTRHNVAAIGFVNENKITRKREKKARLALLEKWVQAGFELGNHTFSHPSLSKVPLADYQADVLKGEILTRKLLQAYDQVPRYFRHPFTHTGPTVEIKAAFEAFLDSLGYAVAPFTVESADYIYNAVYAGAKFKGDTATMRFAAEEYIQHTSRMFDFFEEMSQQTVGRPITHIYLCHANALHADHFDALAEMLEAKGYTFVSLDEALKDPVYQQTDHFIGRFGPSWLHRWNQETFQEWLRKEPDPSPRMLELYKQK